MLFFILAGVVALMAGLMWLTNWLTEDPAHKTRFRNRARLGIFNILEAREMPTVIVWGGGGADNNWSTAANWVGGIQPGIGDEAVFNATSLKAATFDGNAWAIINKLTIQAGYTGTLTLAKNLSVLNTVSEADPNSSIVIPAAIQLGTIHVNFTAGTMGGGGTLQLNGTDANHLGSLNWAGTFNQNLTVTVGQFATISIGSNVTLDKAVVDNSGAATWSAGRITLNNGAVMKNETGATFTVTEGTSIQQTVATDTFINFGTFTLNSQTVPETDINCAFTNQGPASVKVVKGKLAFLAATLDSANMDVSGGATLLFTGFGSVTTVHTGAAFTGVGLMQVDATATMEIPNGNTSTCSANFVLTGGATMAGGDKFGTGGLFTTTGSSTWSGGTIQTQVTNTGQMSITGAAQKTIDYGILTNSGSVVWNGAGNIDMDDNAGITNTGTFEVKATGNVTSQGTSAMGTVRQIVNADGGPGHVGTFKITGGAVRGVINKTIATQVNFTNNAVIDLSIVVCSLDVGGAFTQGGANSHLKILITGAVAGQYSTLKGDADTNLGGALDISFGGGYGGRAGDSFVVVSGNKFNGTSFGTYNYPAGTTWNAPAYNRTGVPQTLTLSM
jgi:hypothetical protein